jgi:hypothetical protein
VYVWICALTNPSKQKMVCAHNIITLRVGVTKKVCFGQLLKKKTVLLSDIANKKYSAPK